MLYYVLHKKIQKVEECKMKNLGKKLWTMVSVAMLGIAVVGCGGPKVSASESVTIMLDAICKGDDTKVESIGLKKDEVKKVRDMMTKQAEDSASQLGVNLDDETKALIVESTFTLLDKVEYTAETKSEDGDSATVELKVKSVDMNKISEDLNGELEKYVSEHKDVKEDELLKYMFQKQIELIKSTPLKGEEVKTLTATKNGKIWEPKKEELVAIIKEAMGQ